MSELIYETYEEKNHWVCGLCYPEAKEIGEIADGYWFVLENDKYIILGGLYGHRDDCPLVFLDKPTPNPDPNDEHEDNDDPILKESLDWMTRADNSFDKWILPIGCGYDFMHSCIETGGWDQEKYKIFVYWLYDKAGRLIKEWE